MIDLDQLGIVVFGATAVILTQSRSEYWRRRACWFGSAAQPFWAWTTIAHHQYGILAVSAFYAFGWFKGLWQWWLGPALSRRAA